MKEMWYNSSTINQLPPINLQNLTFFSDWVNLLGDSKKTLKESKQCQRAVTIDWFGGTFKVSQDV